MGNRAGLSKSQRNEAIAEKVFAAEKNISFIRAAVVILNTLAYIFLMEKQDTIPWLAYTLIGISLIYTLYVILLQPYRIYHVFLTSYFTYGTDTILITLWILATGGFESPFYILWYISPLAVGFRFSSRSIIFSAFLFSACYVGILLLMGEVKGNEAEIAIRTIYIFLISSLGVLISKEILTQTKQKKQMQQLAAEAKQAEEKLTVQTHLYETMLKAQSELGEGVSIAEDERFVYVNDALCRIYGYSEKELLSLPSYFNLVAPEVRETMKQRLRDRFKADEKSYKGQTIILHKDGRNIHIAYSVKTIHSEGKQQLFSIVRDITEEVRSKEALEKSTIDLERSKELDRKKDEFIGVASHELKTPLTSLKGYIQLVQRTLDERNNPEAAKLYIRKTHIHVERLTALVNDLLDVSRIQAGKLKFNITRFEMKEMIQETVENMQHISKMHKIIIENNFSQVLSGDRARLEQVLTNLITNAVKYSPKADKVIVNAKRQENEMIISVKDFGMGIPREHQQSIFDRFYRVEYPTEAARIPGLGIGLYISAEIVKRHKGRIWAESEEGKGSVFYFSLPITDELI